MENIISALEAFAPLSPEILEAIVEVVIRKEFPKGSQFLEEGKTCRYLGFIEQGIVRAYSYKDGKDITSWFCMENDPCISVSSFITQTPSRESIEVLEDTVLWMVEYHHLQDLYKRFPQLNLIGRLVTEQYFLELEAHTISLQHNTSKERYDQFAENHPEMLQRVPLTHIASFLGMTRENLSRIRRSQQKKR